MLDRSTLKPLMLIQRNLHGRIEVYKISELEERSFTAILELPIPSRTTVRRFAYDDLLLSSISKRTFTRYTQAWDEATRR